MSHFTKIQHNTFELYVTYFNFNETDSYSPTFPKKFVEGCKNEVDASGVQENLEVGRRILKVK